MKLPRKIRCGIKLPIAISVLVLVLFFIAPSAIAQELDKNALKDEVEAFFDEWKTAVENLDLDGITAFYSDRFLQGGMTRGIHRLVYQAQFQLIRRKEGALIVEPEVRSLRFWREGERIYADCDLVVMREERWEEDSRSIDRIFQPMRLAREDGRWLMVGDRSRTHCVVQVGFDGEQYMLTLIAQSAFPLFPNHAAVNGPHINNLSLRRQRRDILGKPFVSDVTYIPRRPEAGDRYTFRIPWADRAETITYRLRGRVDVAPKVLSPTRDMDVAELPLKIEWEPVHEGIEDFNCYEVHIRRAVDNRLVYMFRSIPPERNSVQFGTDERQRAAFGEPFDAFYVEVYAYDVFGNFGITRTRIYNELPQPAGE